MWSRHQAGHGHGRHRGLHGGDDVRGQAGDSDRAGRRERQPSGEGQAEQGAEQRGRGPSGHAVRDVKDDEQDRRGRGQPDRQRRLAGQQRREQEEDQDGVRDAQPDQRGQPTPARDGDDDHGEEPGEQAERQVADHVVVEVRRPAGGGVGGAGEPHPVADLQRRRAWPRPVLERGRGGGLRAGVQPHRDIPAGLARLAAAGGCGYHRDGAPDEDDRSASGSLELLRHRMMPRRGPQQDEADQGGGAERHE